MREIRFRAWDKQSTEMLNQVGVISFVAMQGAPFTSLEWMQSTGLHDKNGKEIYEGDVVRTQWGGIGKTVFHDGAFELLVEDGAAYNVLNELQVRERGLEVIGNIYENPELLFN